MSPQHATADPDTGVRDRGRHVVPVIPLVVVVGFVITAIAVWQFELSLSALREGWEDASNLLARMLPVAWPNPSELLGLTLETLAIGLAGTGVATLVSVPLAMVTSGLLLPEARWTRRGVVALVSMLRSVPTLIFAILAVRVFGLGTLAGVVAVSLHSIGMIARLHSDALENLPTEPFEAVLSSGAGRLHACVAVALPQSLPMLVSIALFRLDINIRASAVIGLVGAGGIGVALQTALGSLQYGRALGVIVIIVGLILVLEVLGVRARTALSSMVADGHASSKKVPGRYISRQRIGRWTVGLGVAVLFLLSFAATEFDLGRVQRAGGTLVEMATIAWPPTLGSGVLGALAETLLMAAAASYVGCWLGFCIALLIARNSTPNRVLSGVLRVVTVVWRGVPELIIALVLVAALGLGPQPGIIALALSSTALAAKLFIDALETQDRTPDIALAASGARRLQIVVGSVVPRFQPALMSNSLFVLDLVLRQSIILGIVGAGGIGFLLQRSVATLRYDRTVTILLLMFGTVQLVEATSRAVRRRVR